jgi:hypothetical protein
MWHRASGGFHPVRKTSGRHRRNDAGGSEAINRAAARPGKFCSQICVRRPSERERFAAASK